MLRFENKGKMDDLGLEINTDIIKINKKRFESGL
jgi:hypothetical protein